MKKIKRSDLSVMFISVLGAFFVGGLLLSMAHASIHFYIALLLAIFTVAYFIMAKEAEEYNKYINAEIKAEEEHQTAENLQTRLPKIKEQSKKLGKAIIILSLILILALVFSFLYASKLF